MKTIFSHLMMLAIAAALIGQSAAAKTENTMNTPGVYAFTMKTIDGKEKPLSEYKGKVALIVNVASFCGYTKQYSALEALYRKYKDKGFAILGFPANNFGAQEPGTDTEIKTFCTSKYDVTFDMFSKISVKGNDQHPFYKYLTNDTGFNGDIEWNFTKFLVDKNGTVVARYKSRIAPNDEQVTQKIEELLSVK
jgi:glutathione peroxidase